MKKTLRGLIAIMGLPIFYVWIIGISIFTDVYFNIKQRNVDWTMIVSLPHWLAVSTKQVWNWVKTGVLKTGVV